MNYHNVEFSENIGQATNEKISALEKFFGKKLPQDYREFLIKTNGGEPENGTIKWSAKLKSKNAGKKAGVISDFIGFTDDPNSSIETVQKNYFESIKEMTNRNFIVIGFDQDSLLLLMSLDEEDYGSIYMIHFEDMGWKETKLQKHLVSSSFEELLVQLSVKSSKDSKNTKEYYGHLFKKVITLPSMEMVVDFENDIGARLPEDYRDFIINVNGGYPQKMKFTFMRNIKSGELLEKIGKVYNFLSLGKIQEDRSLKSYNTNTELEAIHSWMNAKLLVIAEEFTEPSYLMIGIEDKCYGKIYCAGCNSYCRDTYLKAPSLDSVKVADNFNEFLKMLR